MLPSVAQLFLIVISSEALLSQTYASGSKHDNYPLQNGHGDGEKNIAEQITHQMTANDSCSDLWFTPRNGTCHCGSSVHGVVTCNEQTKEVMVLECYCMTNDSNYNQTVVGACLYNCNNLSHTAEYQPIVYHQAPSNCTHLIRSGTLCGECENDFFPRAYSYYMDCITFCSWWKYITIAYLPLTIFVAIILVFRISVVSPKLHAFVSIAQIITVPVYAQRIILGATFTSHSISRIAKTYVSVYAIWNLDFFRAIKLNICLPLTTLQVLALDYLIAVYPMLLMVIAYTLVELHGYGFRPVLLAWRPFHYFFVRFRREWNIQTSIVDAFVTFFILSTTKLLNGSYNLLIPTLLYDVKGDVIGIYLYSYPKLEYMRAKHLPYALLAVTVIALFIVLPLSLLVFSSFRCVRQYKMKIRVLEEFLHAFQQYYKDGTNGTMDCRWYAAYYILVNLGLFLLFSVCVGTRSIVYIFLIIYFTLLALIVLLVEPYKEEYSFYNVLDCVQYLWLAIFCSSIVFLDFSGLFQREYILCTCFVAVCVSTVPLMYIKALVMYKIGKRSGLKFCNKYQVETDLNNSLPDRVYNPNQYKDNCGYVPIHNQPIQVQ